MSFRDIPIRRKLTLIIMLTSSFGLLLAGAAIVSYDRLTFLQRVTDELSALANIVGAQSTAALTFNDPKAAQENLAALKAKPEIIGACIYDANDTVFAKFVRDGQSGLPLPPRALASGEQIEGGTLDLFRDIKQDGETIGHVYLKYD